MKSTFSLLFALVCILSTANAQTMISATYLRTYDYTQIDSLYNANGIPPSILDIEYEVEDIMLWQTFSAPSHRTNIGIAALRPYPNIWAG